MSTPAHEATADTAIIGSGPAGAATALALRAAGSSVVLIERGHDAGWKIGEGLPPAAKPILRQLGVWERFIADGHLPSYANTSVWGSPWQAQQSFIFDPNGHGWHLDRQRFDALLCRAAADAGAVIHTGTEVLRATHTVRGDWHLLLQSGTDQPVAVRTRFVVDASGRASWFATRHCARRINDDRLVGVVARLMYGRDVREQDTSTFVEAVRTGWWYAAPVPGKRLVVAYLSDGNDSTVRAARTAAGWWSLLAGTQHLHRHVTAYADRIETGPRVVAANSASLDRAAGGSWLAVGDAAMSFDPLSSQGILTALTTGFQAAATIRAQIAGDVDALARYTRFVHETYAQYLKNRAAYYAMEQRWRTASFWQRRHQVPTLA